MAESSLNIGKDGETPSYMNIPMRHGGTFGRNPNPNPNPNPRLEERQRRYMIKALQRPPRGIHAKIAAQGIKPDSGFLSRVQKLGLTMEDIAPFLNAFKTTTTTGTYVEVERGSKTHSSYVSYKVVYGGSTPLTCTKAEGMHNHPLKSLPSSESLVVDTNPAPTTASASAEVQGGSLLKRPCEVLGESSETLQENKKQMVPKGN